MSRTIFALVSTLGLVGCSPGTFSIPSATGELPAASPVEADSVDQPASSVVDDEMAADPSPARSLLDPWSINAHEDGEACRAALTAAGFKFRALPDRKEPERSGCGMPHGVIVSRGPTGIVYDPPLMVDCALARSLVDVERIVQEEAATTKLGSIARIANLGSFACRKRSNNRRDAGLSAHAFGTAIDISSFQPARGKPASVLKHYGSPGTEGTGDAARYEFLHAVLQRLRSGEADLTYTIGPDFNAAHRNHFHLDRGGWAFWYAR